MNPTVLVVLVVLVVAALAVVIFALARRKKKTDEMAAPSAPTATLAPSEEQPSKPGAPPRSPQEPPSAEEEPEALGGAAEPAPTVEPAPPPAPGVRLDEKAEEEAAERLQAARRERKLQSLRQGLSKTRGGFIAKIGALFKEKKEIDPSLLVELEDTLLSADVGAQTTGKLISAIKEALDKNELADSEAVWNMLRDAVREILDIKAVPLEIAKDKPFTMMVVGVNGVGKTTTIGKLATKYTEQGLKVVLAAGDTFRAAAVNQLEIWGRRSNSEVVKSKEGADPSAVIFDSIKTAKEAGADVVIADTAGRLQTKVPLMEELKKIGRVMGKAHDGAPHEVLLVLDATTGQNAIQQVAMFKETIGLTGIVLTKLDGTAKGGVIIGICHEHKVPVRFIGIGEAKDDLREFEVDDFVSALFLRDEC